MLGKASELNYVTPMWVILTVYANSVLAAWLGMFTVMSSIRRIQNFVHKAAELTVQPSAQWEQMRTWDKLKLAA